MMFLHRLMYLAYYFRHMNWSMLWKFMAYTKVHQGLSYPRQWCALIGNSIRYNISPLEYYQFGFPGLAPTERSTWAGTGTMYEFQLKANPPQHREVLRDKRLFYQAYRQFFRHQMYSLEELEQDSRLQGKLVSENEKLVFKSATGNCGKSVDIIDCSLFSDANIAAFMRDNHYDLVETFARQHPMLNDLSPSAVNTVRIFTRLDDADRCCLLGCRLRISVNSPVDNLAAGNIAAPIDETTGIVIGPGVYSDITKTAETIHPVTGVSIVGFQLPFWTETLALVDQASRLHPENRSIGWDIVITPEGPGLIEGNHDWCKLVWQLPVKTGLKNLLN